MSAQNGKLGISRAAALFLLPNFTGFLIFTLFPVILSLLMAFSNWSLRPAESREMVGLRNFGDLLWVDALGGQDAGWLPYIYAAFCGMLLAGLLGLLWAGISGWTGKRPAGILLGLLGTALIVQQALYGIDLFILVAGVTAAGAGLAVALFCEEEWRAGRAVWPVVALIIACAGLCLLSPQMWREYQPRDPRFWQYLYNTLFLMLGIPVSIAASLGLALLLNHDLHLPPGKIRRLAGAGLCVACGLLTLGICVALDWSNAGVVGLALWLALALGAGCGMVAYRTIYYLPSFTAGVALMILWKALYNPESGPVNALLRQLYNLPGLAGLETPDWLGSITWAKPALIFMGIWTAAGGTNMLLYLSALSGVPQHLIEAAEIDGAGRWAKFRHVVWPQVLPATFFIMVMSVIGGLQGGFEQARVMTGGGPAGATTTLSYYIYNKAFEELDLGYAAAISWVLFAIIFVATAINWRFGKDLETE